MNKTGWKKVDKENPEWNDIDTMLNESDPVLTDDPEEELEMPKLDLDLEKVESESASQAQFIVERLSGYYFDAKYVDEHPYITCKIGT